jgi:hypothetical protein
MLQLKKELGSVAILRKFLTTSISTTSATLTCPGRIYYYIDGTFYSATLAALLSMIRRQQSLPKLGFGIIMRTSTANLLCAAKSTHLDRQFTRSL